MKTNHTPGPWTPQRPIDGSAGIHVFYREPHFGESFWTRIDGADHMAVALALGLTDEEVRERARLIAAAPELLAALESAAAQFDFTVTALAKGQTVSISSLQNCAALARQALAKASAQ